jgi:hypothetical protein
VVFSTVLSSNLIRSFTASDVAADKVEQNGTWLWSNAGFSLGFGTIVGSATSAVAINLGNADQVAGVQFSVGVTPSWSSLAKGGNWLKGQLPLLKSLLNQVGTPGVLSYSNVQLALSSVQEAFIKFSGLSGDSISASSGRAGLTLGVGGGLTFNAHAPGLLTGFSVGGSLSGAVGIATGYPSLGVYGEGSIGLNDDFTPSGAYYVGGGFTVGYGGSSDSSVSGGIVISDFIPFNVV